MSVVVVECRAYLACYRTVNMILVSQLKPSLEVPVLPRLPGAVPTFYYSWQPRRLPRFTEL